jgi:asparaginyl-tRNA synthetase
MDHIEAIVSGAHYRTQRGKKKQIVNLPWGLQICETVDKLMQSESSAALIKQLNPSFTPPTRPFKRLSYVDAIAWLNEHGIEHEAEDADGNVITNTEGKPTMVPHAIGDDIAEKAERQMTDIIGTPIFLHSFPAGLKAFYMKKKKDDQDGEASAGAGVYTESCDLLMPGVGEIVGASMRISDIDELLAAYKREGIDPAPYYWFTDQRKYGTCEHGGYGLGVEVCSSIALFAPPSLTTFILSLFFLLSPPRSTHTLAIPGVARQQVYR